MMRPMARWVRQLAYSVVILRMHGERVTLRNIRFVWTYAGHQLEVDETS